MQLFHFGLLYACRTIFGVSGFIVGTVALVAATCVEGLLWVADLVKPR